MKVEDLRLGNWVKIDVGVGQVCCLMTIEFEDYSLGEGMPICVDVEEYACPRSCTVEEVDGIELTEDILLGCGFKKRLSPLDGYIIYSIYRSSKYNGLLSCLNIYHKKDFTPNIFLVKEIGMNGISYVHELQNAFYAMNKEELEVKL